MATSSITIDAREALRQSTLTVDIRVRGWWAIRLRARVFALIVGAASALLGTETEISLKSVDGGSTF